MNVHHSKKDESPSSILLWLASEPSFAYNMNENNELHSGTSFM